MNPVTIRYRLTEPEFMSACNAHWTAHRQGSKGNFIVGFIGVVVGVTLTAYMFWVAILALIAGSGLILITFLRSFLWKRAFRDAKKFNNDISVTLNDDVIHVESAEGTSDLQWSFYSWYLDTPDYVLLYQTKRNFSVIPKSAFQESVNARQFIETIKTRLKSIR
jgi:hypothetical protein